MSLEVHDRDGIRELRLNAPPANVIDGTLCEELSAAIRERARDPHLKALLFTGAGKHFSYGASVPDHVAGRVEEFLPAFHRVFLTLAEAPIPAIAAVRGLCLGGAMELAACCNLVIAEESAEFAVPEITLGVIPPVACIVLPWRLGGAIAEDLILTGRRMPAAEAAHCGFVTRLCARGELESEVEAFVREKIEPLSAAALRLAARAARGPLIRALGKRLPELEKLYLEEVMATKDAHEGILAFLEKRKPAWVDA